MTRYLLTALALLVPTLAQAAAWDVVANVGAQGRWRTVATIKLCDQVTGDGTLDCDPVTAGDQTTGTWDFGNSTTTPKRLGRGDTIVLERADSTGCAGDLTATFSTSNSTGATFTFHALGATTAVNNATSRIVIDSQGATLDRFLRTAVSNVAACDDGEIWMTVLERVGNE